VEQRGQIVTAGCWDVTRGSKAKLLARFYLSREDYQRDCLAYEKPVRKPLSGWV